MYQKFQADQIFTGKKLLEGNPKCGSMNEGFTPILVVKEDGTIEDIVNKEEAGEDIQIVQGTLTPGFIVTGKQIGRAHV